MEPVKAKVKYVIETSVISVFERLDSVHVDGIGEAATFRESSRGWFVLFDGSHEALFLGKEKPNIANGDLMRITFEPMQ
jgi:hypothetical protein